MVMEAIKSAGWSAGKLTKLIPMIRSKLQCLNIRLLMDILLESRLAISYSTWLARRRNNKTVYNSLAMHTIRLQTMQ